MKSFWNKWLSQPGQIRVVTIEATELMNGLIVQQSLHGLAQLGYSEAVVGSLLIASGHKENESINMNAQGSGVFKQAIIDASPEGHVRGFLIEEKDASMHTFGEMGTNGPWGSGVLAVLHTKNFEGKYPYRGMVPISSGFLDEAIDEYFRDSEQVTSRIGLDVEFSGQQITHARGALVQALGGASEQELQDIRSLSVADVRKLARLSDKPEESQKEISRLLKGREFKLVENRPLTRFCNCSQERIERALLLSGESDIVEALGEDPYLEITCDFCRTQYKVSRERIFSIFSRDPSRLQ